MPVVEERRAEEEEDGVQRGHVGHVRGQFSVCCKGSTKLFNKLKMPR